MTKKIILLLLILPFLTKAQIYFGVNSSFSVGSNGRSLQEFLLMDVSVNQSTFQNLITEKKASFGGGLFISPIVGYQVSKFIGFELQAGRYKTNTLTSVVTYTNPSDDKVTISMSGKVLSLKPSLIGYIYKSNPLIYTKVGAVYSNCEFNINVEYQKTKKLTSQLINGGKSLGISLGVGADWQLNKRFFIRTELSYINANYFPKKGEFTKFDINGINQLPNMTNDQKSVRYVKEGYVEQTYLGAALDPGIHLSPQIPISSMGLSVSLIYKFSK